MKFKLGDEVKIIDLKWVEKLSKNFEYDKKYLNKIGKIASVDDDDLPYGIEFKEGSFYERFQEHQLELVDRIEELERQEEIIIQNSPDKDAQIKVKLFPKRKIKSRKTNIQNKLTDEIDIVELCLSDIDGNEYPIQMTPDEALEIAGLLSQSVTVYLNMFNKEYKEKIASKRKNINNI